MFGKTCVAGAIALALLSCAQAPATDIAPDPTQKCTPPRIILRRPGDNLPPNATYQNNSAPPIRFRADNKVSVQFASPAEVERLCGATKPICGFHIMACQIGNRLILPNPCSSNSVVEPYGKLVCHELAHANGWPTFHGD